MEYIQQKYEKDFEQAFQDGGFVLLGWAEVGFIYVFSSKLVTAFADLRALKPWMWEGDPIAQSAYQAIGVSPVPLSTTDVMTSLQTGMVDAVYASPYTLIALQWFTRVSYAMTQPLADALGAAIVSKKIYDSLPDDLKAILLTNSRKYISRLTASSRQDNAKAIETLKARGSSSSRRPPEIASEFDTIGKKARQLLVGTLYSQEFLAEVERSLAGVPRGAPRLQMKIVRLIDRGLTALVTVLLVCSFTLMLGLAAVQVVLREIMHTNILWGDMAARHLVIWVGFFGAYLASRGGRHFHIGFLSRLLGPRMRAVVRRRLRRLCRRGLRVPRGAGWTFVTVGLDPHAILFLGIRQTAAAMIVPAGFLLMALQFTLRTVQGVGKAVRPGRAAIRWRSGIDAAGNGDVDRGSGPRAGGPRRRAAVRRHRRDRSPGLSRRGNGHRCPHRGAVPPRRFPRADRHPPVHVRRVPARREPGTATPGGPGAGPVRLDARRPGRGGDPDRRPSSPRSAARRGSRSLPSAG